MIANDSKARRGFVWGMLATVVLVVTIVVGWRAFTQRAPVPEPSPTTSADPTPSVAPSPSVTPLPEFPSAATTGVRPGVVLTDSGSLTIDEPGTVIEGLRVKGRIVVNADDVVIRDTLVEGGGAHYPIRISRGVKNVLIEYVEVHNDPGGGIGIFFNSGSGTVRYANIHTATDGIRVQADDVTIEHSYIHSLKRISGGHHDSIQIRSGANVVIRGNSLLPYVAETNDPMNAAIQIGSLTRDPLVDLRVEGNFMDGGNYTINGGKDIESGSFVGNVFGPHARYGIRTRMSPEIEWRDNIMAETREPA